MIRGNHEICISYYNTHKDNRIVISFSEEAACVLSEYISPQILDDKLYFNPATDRHNGVKVAKRHNYFNTSISRPEFVKSAKDFEGCYSLHFDSKADMYFIRKSDAIQTETRGENKAPKHQPTKEPEEKSNDEILKDYDRMIVSVLLNKLELQIQTRKNKDALDTLEVIKKSILSI